MGLESLDLQTQSWFTGHIVHTSPATPTYPSKHVHELTASLPPGELVPAGHTEHSTAPVTDLYVPEMHAVHSTPSEAAVYEVVHVQSSSASLCIGELVCSGHVEHTPVPVTDLYVATAHGVHASPSDRA